MTTVTAPGPVALVEQAGRDDCGAACLATVTGEPLAAVKAAVDVPTPHAQLEAYLQDHPIANDLVTVRGTPTVGELAAQSTPFARPMPFDRRTLVLTVASPARTVDWHAVVYDRGRVLDPGGHFDRERLFSTPCIWASEVYPAYDDPQ